MTDHISQYLWSVKSQYLGLVKPKLRANLINLCLQFSLEVYYSMRTLVFKKSEIHPFFMRKLNLTIHILW